MKFLNFNARASVFTKNIFKVNLFVIVIADSFKLINLIFKFLQKFAAAVFLAKFKQPLLKEKAEHQSHVSEYVPKDVESLELICNYIEPKQRSGPTVKSIQ